MKADKGAWVQGVAEGVGGYSSARASLEYPCRANLKNTVFTNLECLLPQRQCRFTHLENTSYSILSLRKRLQARDLNKGNEMK